MRISCTITFIFLYTLIIGQINNYPILNKKDTTLTFSYTQSVRLAKSLENLSFVQDENLFLKESSFVKDIIIKKLQLKDTLMQIELGYSKQIEMDLKEKIRIYEDIESNYKKLVFSAEEQLKAEKRKTRNEQIWKNIYKYGYPVLIGAITILLFK